MSPMTRLGWVVLGALAVLAACYHHSSNTDLRSNYSDVRIDGDRLVAAATGEPYNGTVVAADHEISEIGAMVFRGTMLERVAGIDPGGLVLVLPVVDGVPSGRATVHADLRSPKLSADLSHRRDQLGLAVAKTLSPRLKIAEAVFERGKLEGRATLLAPGAKSSGTVTLAEAEFRSGLPDGVAREYVPGTKTLKRQMTFRNGVLEGPYRSFYANGSVRRESNFVAGQPAGTEQMWFPTGKLQMQIVHSADSTAVKTWYSNGRLESSTGPDGDVRHPPHGTIVEYHRSGAVHTKTTYEQGVRHGAYAVFYSNGRKWERGAYDGGKRTGDQSKWWKNGRVALEANWSNDALDGRFSRWYASGKRWELATYESGKRIGRYQKWWKSGARAHDYEYVRGKLSGRFQTWYDSGARWAAGDYDSGKPAGTMRRWFPDGRLGYIKHHKNGRAHGAFLRWYANGTPRLEANYDKGRLDGTFRNWLEDGSVYEIATYERGAKTTSTLNKTP